MTESEYYQKHPNATRMSIHYGILGEPQSFSKALTVNIRRLLHTSMFYHYTGTDENRIWMRDLAHTLLPIVKSNIMKLLDESEVGAYRIRAKRLLPEIEKLERGETNAIHYVW